jgi:hypothetical protein
MQSGITNRLPRTEEERAMGKLVEKLHQVSQATGTTIGFLGGRAPAQKPRPAALLVALDVAETALAEAALKAGADGLILTNWTPSGGLGGLKSVLAPKEVVWGVELAAAGTDADVLKRAAEAGAAFAILDPSAPARSLFGEIEKFDLVAGVEMPTSELGLVLIRSQGLLPAQVGLLRPEMAQRDVARMTVADYARLRVVVESLRFPVLLALQAAPDEQDVSTLVHLGIAGLVLKGQGVSAQQLGAQVQALRETLEKTPTPKEDREGVSLAGLMPAPPQAAPGRPQREPEREPEHE